MHRADPQGALLRFSCPARCFRHFRVVCVGKQFETNYYSEGHSQRYQASYPLSARARGDGCPRPERFGRVARVVYSRN